MGYAELVDTLIADAHKTISLVSNKCSALPVMKESSLRNFSFLMQAEISLPERYVYWKVTAAQWSTGLGIGRR